MRQWGEECWLERRRGGDRNLGPSPCLREGARDAPPGSINPLNPRRRKRRVVGWDYCGQLPNIFSPSGISVHISFLFTLINKILCHEKFKIKGSSRKWEYFLWSTPPAHGHGCHGSAPHQVEARQDQDEPGGLHKPLSVRGLSESGDLWLSPLWDRDSGKQLFSCSVTGQLRKKLQTEWSSSWSTGQDSLSSTHCQPRQCCLPPSNCQPGTHALY